MWLACRNIDVSWRRLASATAIPLRGSRIDKNLEGLTAEDHTKKHAHHKVANDGLIGSICPIQWSLNYQQWHGTGSRQEESTYSWQLPPTTSPLSLGSLRHAQYAFKFYFHLRVHVSVYVCAHRSQKRVSDPLELEWQAVLSCPMWVLGTKLESFGGAESILNRGAIDLAPCHVIYKLTLVPCYFSLCRVSFSSLLG